MWKYLLKRFLLMFPTLVGVAVVTFFLIRVIPGDVVELRLAGDRGSASQAAIDAERVRFGLDQPVWKQFATWMVGVARLDFGTSMWTGSPIWDEIKLRFALSLQVAIMATLVAVVLAVPLGLLAALRQDSWIDYALRIFSIAGLACPRGGLSLHRGGNPHAPHPHARGAPGGLRAHRAGQGPGAAPHPGPPRAQERDAPGADRHRARVRVPHRWAGGHRAGLQPQRHRPALRAGGGPP